MMRSRIIIAYTADCRSILISVNIENGLFLCSFIFLPDINNIVQHGNTTHLFSYIIASTFILHSLISLNFEEK